MKEAKGGGRKIQEGIRGRKKICGELQEVGLHLLYPAGLRVSYRFQASLGRASYHYVKDHDRTTRNNKLQLYWNYLRNRAVNF